MINRHFFLALLGALLFCPTSLLAQDGQGALSLELNGQVVSEEDITHQFFCGNRNDQFVVSYLPAAADSMSQFAINGIQLWAQVAQGQPQLVGTYGRTQPGSQPSVAFKLRDFPIMTTLPEGTQAIRVSIRPQVIKVQGRRFLGYIQLPKADQEIAFMVVKRCPE
ncbi:MAG: hypothetical protein AAFR61_25025 [Bacteroidota bacterium]